MNLNNLTIALIVALIYEILLKLGQVLIPSFLNITQISSITSVLSIIIVIIIILFIYFFYIEEKSDNKIEMVLKLLIGCFIINFILRLLRSQSMIGYDIVRLSEEIIGFIEAILLLGLSVLYKRRIPPGERLLEQATVFITIMFGIGIVKSLISLFDFTRFVFSGLTIDYPPVFYTIMIILFFITHSSIIYFLYRYYQLKSKVEIYIKYVGKNSK